MALQAKAGCLRAKIKSTQEKKTSADAVVMQLETEAIRMEQRLAETSEDVAKLEGTQKELTQALLEKTEHCKALQHQLLEYEHAYSKLMGINCEQVNTVKSACSALFTIQDEMRQVKSLCNELAKVYAEERELLMECLS